MHKKNTLIIIIVFILPLTFFHPIRSVKNPDKLDNAAPTRPWWQEEAPYLSKVLSISITAIPLFCMAIHISGRQFMRYLDRRYKAPEHVQKQAQKFFDTMYKNDNFFNRILAWFKKKLGFITVYQGCTPMSTGQTEILACSSTMTGISFPKGSFHEDKTLKKEQLCSLIHETYHEYQFSLSTIKEIWEDCFDLFLSFFYPSCFYPYEYKNEFLAEEKTIQILGKLNLKKAQKKHVMEWIEAILKGDKYLIIRSHPYSFGTLNAFLAGEGNVLNRLKALRWVEEKYRGHPKSIDTAINLVEKFSTNQKRNWKDGYKKLRTLEKSYKPKKLSQPNDKACSLLK